MEKPTQFRTAINGFNREDVVRYLEYINTKHSSEMAQARNEIAYLREQLSSAPKKTSEAGQDAARGMADDMDARERILELTAQLEEAKSDLSAEKETTSSLRIQLRNAEMKSKRRENMDAASLQEELDRAKETCAQLKAKLAASELKVQELQGDFNREKEIAADLREQLQDADARLELRSDDDPGRLLERLQKEQEAAALARRELEEEQKVSQQLREQLEGSRKVIRSIAESDGVEEISKLQSQLLASEGEAAELREQVSLLRAELKTAHEENEVQPDDRDGVIRSLRAEIAAEQARSAQLRQALDEQRSQPAETAEDTGLQEQVKALQGELDRTRALLSQSEKELLLAQGRPEQARAQLEQTQSQLARIQAQKEELQAQLEQTQSKVVRLQNLGVEAETAGRELQKKLADAEAELAALRDRTGSAQSMQYRIDELSAKLRSAEEALSQARDASLHAELETYRRAESVERNARERASRIVGKLGESVEKANAQAAEASQQMAQMVEQLAEQMETLQRSVALSRSFFDQTMEKVTDLSREFQE